MCPEWRLCNSFSTPHFHIIWPSSEATLHSSSRHFLECLHLHTVLQPVIVNLQKCAVHKNKCHFVHLQMAQYYITFYIKQDKSLTGNCLNCLHFSFLLLTSAARIKGFISHTVKFIVRFKFLLSMSKDLKMPLCLYPYHLIITSYFS